MKNNKWWPKQAGQMFILFVLFLILFIVPVQAQNKDKGKILFFWGQGCPHCARVESFIQKNKLDQIFDIESKEIYFNKQNRQEFLQVCEQYRLPPEKEGVPMALIDGQCIVGDEPIIKALQAKVDNLKASATSASSTAFNQSGQQAANKPTSFHRHLTLSMILGAAAVDAINPCAFAVLIILMSTVLASGQRRRALLAGLAFATAIYISYLLMGLGIYQALSTAKLSGWFMKFIGVLAVVVGLFNIKDYFWYGGGGFVMEVPMSWRPKMKALIRSVTSPAGAFVIGFLVSLFLLPCTSGPYIVILGMLAQKETFATALGWLVLYNFIFILPMIIISLAVYFGFKPERAEAERQKRLRLLHLIAGLIMIGMGIVILFNFI